MFDEDKINELLRGASPKKKSSSSKKKETSPHKEGGKKKELEKTESSGADKGRELTAECLQEIGNMIGSNSGATNPQVQQNKQNEKPVSIKNIQQRQEYIHEKKLAEDRLRRLKQAEKRIEELEKASKEASSQITEEQTKRLQQLELEAQSKAVFFEEQRTQLEDMVSQQKDQIQQLLQEKEQLAGQCAELQNTVERKAQNKKERKEITQVFQEHGLHSEEYRDVMMWLIQTGIFPLSYVQTQHYGLLQQILRDKCHIQASNVPLPKESNDIYIDASLDRCPLSGGQDIMEQARLFKDECLIHGYTTIVMFGTQGRYEPLFQILFAHHALRVTLSPLLQTLSLEDAQHQIEANQLSFSWGENGGVEVNYTSTKQTVGGFLHDLVSYLRSML